MNINNNHATVQEKYGNSLRYIILTLRNPDTLSQHREIMIYCARCVFL